MLFDYSGNQPIRVPRCSLSDPPSFLSLSLSLSTGRLGPGASKDTQTPTLVPCKQEPPDPVEIVGSLGDHLYAEPEKDPGSLQCKTEEPDRTQSGPGAEGPGPEGSQP